MSVLRVYRQEVLLKLLEESEEPLTKKSMRDSLFLVDQGAALCAKNLSISVSTILNSLVAEGVVRQVVGRYKTPGPCRGEDHWIETPAFERVWR